MDQLLHLKVVKEKNREALEARLIGPRGKASARREPGSAHHARHAQRLDARRPCACAQEVLKACKAAIKKAKKALKEALKGDDALGDLIAAR